MEIRLIFDEFANQAPDIAKVAEPQRLRPGWINGVEGLSVTCRS
jgi:cholest-4-en-3-one 26-monooxygenase